MIFETLDTRNILDRYRRQWCSSSRSTNPEMFNDAILHDDILVEQTGWPPDHAGDSERWRNQGGDLSGRKFARLRSIDTACNLFLWRNEGG